MIDAIYLGTGPEVRPSLPTLDEYVALTPRHVTPVRASPQLGQFGRILARTIAHNTRSTHTTPT